MILLIIDKSQLITDRLLALAKDAENITAVHTAATHTDALILAEKLKPGIVLLAMNLPASKSIDIIKKIKKGNSHTAFIVLFDEVNEIKKQYCELLGVDFILDKYHDVEKIVPAINALTRLKKKNSNL
jgi:DNA-binding NarL/FixJ family response regulator